jgi:hypothetical protein
LYWRRRRRRSRRSFWFLDPSARLGAKERIEHLRRPLLSKRERAIQAVLQVSLDAKIMARITGVSHMVAEIWIRDDIAEGYEAVVVRDH